MTIIAWTFGIVFVLGTIVFIYGMLTAEENNDPDEWD